MGGKAQVHVQVESERKAAWKDHAEDDPENPNGSLSFLIKRAVERQIQSDDADAGASVDVEDVDLSGITEGQATTHKELSRLKDTLDDVVTTVESVERAVTSDTERRPLKERLYEALPPAKPKTKAHSMAEHDDPNSRHTYRVAWSGKLPDICVRVGEPPEKVKDKLNEMGVPRGEVDGELRYWMEDRG